MNILLATFALLSINNAADWAPPNNGTRIDKVPWSRADNMTQSHYRDRLFTIGDQTFEHNIKVRGNWDRGGSAVFSVVVAGSFTSLETFVGVMDTERASGTLEVVLDGEPYSTTQVEPGERATKLSVPLTGVKTLTFKMKGGVTLAEPYLLKGATKTTTTTKVPGAASPKPAAPPPGNRPSLLTPSEGAVLSGDSAILRWKPIDNATRYSVILVCSKLVGPAAAPDVRTWTWTVSEPTCTVPIKDLPAGEYLWSVVAFGKEKPLGGYSAERLFKVER